MQIKHLLGCAPLLPMLLATSACVLDPAGSSPGLAVIVGFSTPTPGSAPETLDRLTKAGASDARFVSSLSPRSHSYRLQCPTTDPGCNRMLDALRRQPGVDYASIDKPKDTR